LRLLDVSKTDHHSEYLAKAIAALTPEGRKRVDELLEQLTEVVGDHHAVASFAAARRAEVDAGGAESAGVGPERALSRQELDILIPGFRAIRDQEHEDDVADWANAVVALLEDEGRNSAS
jgi:hypothetical protein